MAAPKIKNKPRVLIVEDDPFFRESLCTHFHLLECETLEAENGQEALAVIAKEKITAIMCDIQMPKMNGIQFLNALRERKIDIPVLIMTGYSGYSDEEIAKHGGVVLLQKPFDDEQLTETIEGFIKLL